MGKAEKNREMKCEKWCVPESGKGGFWLPTRVRWLKKDDVIRGFENGKVKKNPVYVVMGDGPYWSDVHKCWDIKMGIFNIEKE